MTALKSSDGRYACIICETVDGTPTLRIACRVSPADGDYLDLCSIEADTLFVVLARAGLLPGAARDDLDPDYATGPDLPF